MVPPFRWLIRQGRLTWRLVADKRVSIWLKLIVPATFLYLIVPVDLLPGYIFPGLGFLDDLAVTVFGLTLFIRLCPRHIVEEHLSDIDSILGRVKKEKPPEPGSYIEGSYRVIDDKDEDR